jgi:hypothetical protein
MKFAQRAAPYKGIWVAETSATVAQDNLSATTKNANLVQHEGGGTHCHERMPWVSGSRPWPKKAGVGCGMVVAGCLSRSFPAISVERRSTRETAVQGHEGYRHLRDAMPTLEVFDAMVSVMLM